jgi:KaiC/GvpD/RAD55 family RecA-like ATPase
MKTLNNVISKQILLERINNLYSNGLPFGLTTGVQNIDNVFRLDRGKLVTVTGIPNMGKSEFVDFLCTQYNKMHNLKTIYFSPENQPLELHISKLISKFTNKSFDDKSVDKTEYNNIVNHILDNYHFLNYDNVFNLDVVLSEATNLINNDENIGVLVIDSYNKLEAQKEFNVTETDYISKVLDTLERYAKKMNIVVILVAHPKKMQKNEAGAYNIPSPYDVNGSANFFNKSDYCLTVHRDFINDNVIIKCDKVKFKNYGAIGELILGYNIPSGNYFGIDDSISNFETGLPDRTFEPYNFIIPEFKEEDQTNTIDLNDIQVDYFNTISDTVPKECTLNDILFSNKFDDQKTKVDRVRNEKDIERKKVHKNCLMNYSISCTFNQKRDSKDVKRINPIICIDIDKQDNEQIINKVPEILKNIDNVMYYSKSCSGQGYFCLIPISNINKFSEHWNSLNDDFKKLGIVIDKQCKDISRVRYYSYDSEYYYNPNAAIYSRFKEVSKERDKTDSVKRNNPQFVQKTENNDIYIKLEEVVKDCKKNNIELTDTYTNWFNTAMGLINEYGENGRVLFHQFSNLSNKYDSDKTDNFYNDLLDKYEENNEITVNTIFHLYNELKK